MRRALIVAATLVVLAAGGYAAYMRWGEELLQAEPPADVPAAPVLAPGSVSAEAVVVPVQYAALSLPVTGIVAEVLVEEGQQVEQDAVLARLESDREVIAVAQAQTAVEQARAALDKVVNGARTEEIAAAQAVVDAARAQLDILVQGPREEDIQSAQAAVAAAQAAYELVAAGADDQALIAARADLANAEALLEQAQRAYDEVSWRSDIGAMPQSSQLQTATNQVEAARARFEELASGAEPAALAQAAAQVEQVQAQLLRLQAPPTEAELAAAEAAVAQAQAQLDLLLAGARAEDIAAAQADLSRAETEAMQAQRSLDDRTLRAPFAGQVAALDLHVGQQVVAGTPAVQLADTSAWRVETTDLTELNVLDIEVGDPVSVEVDALPGVTLAGHVVGVKPLGENVQGDIAYTVTIEPDEYEPRLRWNMTAAVTFEAP